jgi:hypothetical protein
MHFRLDLPRAQRNQVMDKTGSIDHINKYPEKQLSGFPHQRWRRGSGSAVLFNPGIVS